MNPRKSVTRVALIALGMALLLDLLAVAGWRRLDLASARLPAFLAEALPADCRQVILVLSPERRSIKARCWLLERTASGAWRPVQLSRPVNLGGHGLAWGREATPRPAPLSWPTKQEGDGCSPAGVFPVTFAFGYSEPSQAAWLRLPYRELTDTLFGVDDARSRYYNQVVDAAQVTPDWDSAETMRRADDLYQWGAFVAHNPDHAPGAGSCIFLHLWSGPGQGTAGCTALAEEDLKRILAWLDPAARPHLAQWVE